MRVPVVGQVATDTHLITSKIACVMACEALGRMLERVSTALRHAMRLTLRVAATVMYLRWALRVSSWLRSNYVRLGAAHPSTPGDQDSPCLWQVEVRSVAAPHPSARTSGSGVWNRPPFVRASVPNHGADVPPFGDGDATVALAPD